VHAENGAAVATVLTHEVKAGVMSEDTPVVAMMLAAYAEEREMARMASGTQKVKQLVVAKEVSWEAPVDNSMEESVEMEEGWGEGEAPEALAVASQVAVREAQLGSAVVRRVVMMAAEARAPQ